MSPFSKPIPIISKNFLLAIFFLLCDDFTCKKESEKNVYSERSIFLFRKKKKINRKTFGKIFIEKFIYSQDDETVFFTFSQVYKFSKTLREKDVCLVMCFS